MSQVSGLAAQFLTIAPGEIAKKTLFLDELLGTKTISGNPAPTVTHQGESTEELEILDAAINNAATTQNQMIRYGSDWKPRPKTVDAGLALQFTLDGTDAVDGRNYLIELTVSTTEGETLYGAAEVLCRRARERSAGVA